ncbi:hypothetical protein D9C11_00535 [Bacillus subtilis subsp. subtilis]|nr:hypothetical protein D9C11_00535 [Bacillus subtilis subsp. subtilis]
MSLLLDAYNLMVDNKNPLSLNKDYVFLHTVPTVMPDDVKLEDVKQPIVKITHIINNRGDFASNKSQSVKTSIQIQIWYEYDDQLADNYEELLNDYLESNEFYPIGSYISVDPDIEKIYLTAKFNKKAL